MRKIYLNYHEIDEVFHQLHDSIESYNLYQLMTETMTLTGKDPTDYYHLIKEKVRYINRSDLLLDDEQVAWSGD